MKKKLLASILSVLLLGLLCACASNSSPEEVEEEVPQVDIDDQMQALDPDDYVTLGDYDGLPAEIAYYTFSEEDVQMCVENDLGFYVEYFDLYDYEPIVSANTVENGSLVNIDYRGTLDGVAFDGGTAAGAHLLIGSGSFIPGFEDGLIGANVGDVVELNVTFPENYTEELAGQDAVFTVSVNSIDIQLMPTFTDELIASMNLGEDLTTYDAYVQYVRDYLKENCDEENQYILEDTVWEAAYSVCQVSDPPEFLVNSYVNDLEEYYESYAAYYGMDMETFVTSQMGITMEEYARMKQEYAIDQAKVELAYMAIAKAEGIDVDDAKIQEVAEEEYEMYGYISADEFITSITKFDFRSYVRRKLVTERLKEKIKIIELEPVSYLQSGSEG